MPTYDFVNTQTGESFTQMMRIAEKEQFLEANPHIQQQIGAPATISGGNFQKKMDSGWKENMARIAEAHPNSAFAEKMGGRSVTKSKVSNATKKHGLGKRGHYDMKL